jgi:hypothetical protein
LIRGVQQRRSSERWFPPDLKIVLEFILFHPSFLYIKLEGGKNLSMRSFRRRMTLDEALSFADIVVPLRGMFLKYDPDVIPQYRIRRCSTHDGTLLFSIELMVNALYPLVTLASYFKLDGVPPDGAQMKYTVGRIRRWGAYGRVDLPAGRFPGMVEAVSIPVRAEVVMP